LNIAFPAALIILLVLPGVIFNKCRSVSGRFRSQRQIIDELFPSMGAAGIAHLIWIIACCLISPWTGLTVNIQAVLLLTAGRLGEGQYTTDALGAASSHPIAVFAYFSSLLLACYSAGCCYRHWLLHHHGQVRALTLFSADDESQARRVAEWASLMPIEAPELGITCIMIVASLTIGSKSYLYAGFLRRIIWDESTGEPEWFQLCSTQRRNIEDDREHVTDERWYDVEGDNFMIRFSEVDTLNLIHTSFEDSRENTELGTAAGVQNNREPERQKTANHSARDAAEVATTPVPKER
jgi:hypothetical protein